ncbi:MAG: Hsp70 family protein [Planctomycetes bacterium]|nr:Hsp70 family protein [Planctomycetota bacterium]
MYLRLDLGVEVADGKFLALVPRDMLVPTSGSSVFATSMDNQSFMDLHVMEGETDLVTKSRSVGRYRMEGLPKGPKGQVQFQVTLAVSGTGLLTVKAMDMITGYPIRVSGPENRIVSIR